MQPWHSNNATFEGCAMTIIHLSGEIMILVDQVDVEQICIDQPKLTAPLHIGLQAMTAALWKDDVKSFQRNIAKFGHTLEYIDTQFGKDDFLVRFSLIERKLPNGKDA